MSAFSRYERLEFVTLNDGLQEIGIEDFMICTSLKNVSVPFIVKRLMIGPLVAQDWSPLIKLPDGLESIGCFPFCVYSLLSGFLVKLPRSLIKCFLDVDTCFLWNCQKMWYKLNMVHLNRAH